MLTSPLALRELGLFWIIVLIMLLAEWAHEALDSKVKDFHYKNRNKHVRQFSSAGIHQFFFFFLQVLSTWNDKPQKADDTASK